MATKLSKLKRAHSTLLEEYLNSIENLSYLPFFIETDRDLLGKKFKFQEAKFWDKANWLLSVIPDWLESLVNLKPIAHLLVETHIQAKLRELRRIYRQQKTILKSKGKDKQTQSWMEEAIKETQEMEDTLQSWKVFWDAIATVAGTVSTVTLVVFGISNIFDVVPRLITFINFTEFNTETAGKIIWQFFIAATLPMSIILPEILIGSGFITKRYLFKPHIESGKNIYKLEDDLYQLLNRRKELEFRFDMAFSVIGRVILIIISAVWFKWLFVKLEINFLSTFWYYFYGFYSFFTIPYIWLWIRHNKLNSR